MKAALAMEEIPAAADLGQETGYLEGHTLHYGNFQRKVDVVGLEY
jgi:hypothetical protein